MTDKRRRQYVPLSVRFADGDTGTKILDRFGLEGLAVWACLLSAAKKSPVQGTLEYNSEAEAWSKLGLYEHRPSFTFQDFVSYLGRSHKARTTKVGQVKTTEIRAWNEWNTTIRREADIDKKRRKRAQSTGDISTPLEGTEGEVEVEEPLTPKLKTPRANGTNPRARGTSPRQKGSSPRQQGTNPRTLAKHPCPQCGIAWETEERLTEHLEDVHRVYAVVASDDELGWGA